MKDLQFLPKFSDRWSHLYLEHGRLEKEADSLAFFTPEGSVEVPIHQLGFLMLGPGTAVTHAAMDALAENNTLLAWVGEQGVRLYAHSTGGTHHSARLLRQARLFSDREERLKVVRRMYNKRFLDPVGDGADLEEVRGKEGYRVREAYRLAAAEHGLEWKGRKYDPKNWDWSDPLNQALSTANACLYGLCHAAILSAGYSPAIGFIHTGKMLSFVYDIADLYKTEISVPLAFRTVAQGTKEVGRRVRLALRDEFHRTRLMERILPDIAEVLDAGDDLREDAGELEGLPVTLDDRAKDGRLPWQSELEDQG
jgi:CRISP-associated protein Cas1